MISDEMRKSIIEAYDNGHSKKSIADVLNVNISSVYSIIKVYTFLCNFIHLKLYLGIHQ